MADGKLRTQTTSRTFPPYFSTMTLPPQLQTAALTMEAISKLAASNCGKLQSRGRSKPCQGFKSLYCRTVSQNTSRPYRSNSCTRSGSSPQPIEAIYVLMDRITTRGMGHQGPHLNHMAPGPSEASYRLNLVEGWPMSPVWAVPGWVPWAKMRSLGAQLQALTPSLGPGWRNL